jgi:hypothetical protein
MLLPSGSSNSPWQPRQRIAGPRVRLGPAANTRSTVRARARIV